MAVLKFHCKMADIINTHINFANIPLQKILVFLFLARKLIKSNILDHFKMIVLTIRSVMVIHHVLRCIIDNFLNNQVFNCT